MSETAEAPVQVSAEPTKEQNVQQDTAPSPFGNNSWSEALPEIKNEKPNTEAVATEKPTATASSPTPKEENEEVVDATEWLKREFEVDDPEILKQSIQELKTLREKAAKGYEYKNDDSKKIAEYINEGKEDELYGYLDTKRKVKKLSTVDITDKNIAAELVKFGMQKDNPNLTADEVDFLFNEKYSFPNQPKQGVDELDDDYALRVESWKTQVANIEKRMVIEAKMNQPKLAQLNTEIILPEISKPQVQNNEPTPEQVEALKNIRQNFLNKLESDFPKVEGFSTKVKDESVEIPVVFKIPDEGKSAIKERLEGDGLDPGVYMLERWFDESGNPKIDRIITDIYQLENTDKILSGVANNAANKRLEAYIKQQKNLDVNNNTSQQTYQQNNGNANVSPFSMGAWSEKPPVLANN